MKILKVFLIFCAIPALASPGIPMIGIDGSGKEFVQEVPRTQYVDAVRQLLVSTGEEAIPVLERNRKRLWNLRTLAIGIGLDMGFGFSPFFELRITPRLRVLFSNSGNPVLP